MTPDSYKCECTQALKNPLLQMHKPPSEVSLVLAIAKNNTINNCL